MAKKHESDPEQYKRFLQKVKDMEEAGELDQSEADETFNRAVTKIARLSEASSATAKDLKQRD